MSDPAPRPPRLYLVDGSNYLFRAFYGIRGLTNSRGEPTNAVYGFTGMLLKLVREEKPEHLAVVFDLSGHSFRNEIYPEYKANRSETPEDLVPQIPVVHEVIRAFNIPVITRAGYEADDIIATLASRAKARGMEVVVVSSDKDLMQLVGEGCSLLDTMKDRRYGPAEVEAKMGVPPNKVVELQALMGDAVDNIPGVPGIGPKTAARLVAEHGDLDGVYAAIDQIKGKRRENLLRHRKDAYLSRTLATLDTGVALEVDLGDLAAREPDRKRLTELFSDLEFKTWHREFHDPDALESKPSLSREGYALVRSRAELGRLGEALRGARLVAFDTETTGLDPVGAELVGLSFATDREHAWYVPVGHRTLDAVDQLGLEEALEVLGPILEDPSIPKAAQNAKYDLQILERRGVEVRGLHFDPMLASYLLDPGKYRHSLDQIALDWLNHKTLTFAEVTGSGSGSGKRQITFDQVPLDRARDYACEDAQLVAALTELMEPDLEEAGLAGLLHDMEIPLAHVLARMEMSGVKVDTTKLASLSEELGARAETLERRCHELAGEAFNLGSPKQLRAILFDKLGLPAKKRTKTGYSTDSSVLEELSALHELPGAVLRWRSVTKLKSTYTDVLPALVHPATGRIHTSYNQAVAATGRLSSADPNLQNIPVRSDDGRRIREAFVAEPGHLLLSADYSQIELRILAHLCGDPAMRQAFRSGADIHRRTAAMLFGISEEDVGREQRGIAKSVNFGILYGMSAFRLAREQGITRKAAAGIIERYFQRYPRILEWKESTLDGARKEGFVHTLMGRIRRLADLRSRSAMARRAAERMAINTPVQGTAADIIKMAMIRIDRRLGEEIPKARMVLQVHDELVFEVPREDLERVRELAVAEMEGVAELSVPLVVDTGAGASWLEAH